MQFVPLTLPCVQTLMFLVKLLWFQSGPGAIFGMPKGGLPRALELLSGVDEY